MNKQGEKGVLIYANPGDCYRALIDVKKKI